MGRSLDRLRIDRRLGSFEEVAAAAPEHAGTLAVVRETVAGLHPDAVEVASRKERSVWWGWGPGKMRDGYAYAVPHRNHVNLGFFHGSALADPEGVLEGTGKTLRHVKIQSAEDVRRPAVLALLTAARDERRGARNPQEE